MSNEDTGLVPVDPVLQKYNEINEYFKGKLPNPHHEPIQFAYYLKIYDFFKKRAS